MRLLLLNGPNLNLLGLREPEVYGATTLAELEAMTAAHAASLGVELDAFQSNHEGHLIERIHAARGVADGIVFNPGAFTHSSYALHDAIVAAEVPTVEIHISNVKEREPWRATSLIAPAVVRQIYGRGISGYLDAINHLVHRQRVPVTTHAYGTVGDQVGDLRLPVGGGPFPVIVLYHGGFWRSQWARDLMDALAVELTTRGMATWNVEYRRIPPLGGWRSTIEDAVAALDHLASLDAPLDLSAVQTLGHSAGGHLAVIAAAKAQAVRPTRAISLAGVLDLAGALTDDPDNGVRRFLGDDLDSHLGDASPIAMVPLGVSQLIVHGDRDESVALQISVDYAGAALASGDDVTTMWLAGVDHMSLIDPRSTAWEAITEAL
jgi:3-dehydroquinate dehydratase type II